MKNILRLFNKHRWDLSLGIVQYEKDGDMKKKEDFFMLHYSVDAQQLIKY